MTITVSRSDDENEWIRSIGSCFCRLAQFSSCFSVDSLLSYFNSICLLYHLEDDSSSPDIISESKLALLESSSKRDTIKVSYFNRGLPTDSSSRNLKPLGSAFFDHACDKLASMKISKIRDTLRKLPISLILLSLSILENSFRLDTFYSHIVHYWNKLICESDLSEVRTFSLEMVANIAYVGLSISRIPITFPGTISADVSSIDDLFKVSMNKDISNPQDYAYLQPTREQLIAPLCLTLSTTSYREIAEACLTYINSVLEVAGHDFPAQAWVSVIDALSSASGGLRVNPTYSINRIAPSWATICNMAFRSLKLIVDGKFHFAATKS